MDRNTAATDDLVRSETSSQWKHGHSVLHTLEGRTGIVELLSRTAPSHGLRDWLSPTCMWVIETVWGDSVRRIVTCMCVGWRKRLLIGLAWFFSFLFALPMLFITNVPTGTTQCRILLPHRGYWQVLWAFYIAARNASGPRSSGIPLFSA